MSILASRPTTAIAWTFRLFGSSRSTCHSVDQLIVFEYLLLVPNPGRHCKGYRNVTSVGMYFSHTIFFQGWCQVDKGYPEMSNVNKLVVRSDSISHLLVNIFLVNIFF